MSLCLRHARLIIGLAFGFAIAAFLYVTTQPLMHTSTASFMVQTGRLGEGTAGIAAQLGVTLNQSDPTQSPSLYADMIKSHTLLGALADTIFRFRTPEGVTESTSLSDAYRVSSGGGSGMRRESTIERLARAITVRISPRSGVVTYSVQAPAPDLAREIAMAVLDELQLYNTIRRQSLAGAERRFVERRVAEVAGELRAAEGKFEDFLRQNRSQANSPQLIFEGQRLSREVDMLRTLHSTLVQNYERARIEEVRDTPQLSVIEAAEVPPRPDSRLLIGKTIVAGMVGALLGLLLAVASERLRDAERTSSEDVTEFRRQWRAAIGRLNQHFGARRRDGGTSG